MYISQPDLCSILVIHMRDQHCEEVTGADPTRPDALQKRGSASFATLPDMNFSHAVTLNRRRMTRQKKFINNILTKPQIPRLIKSIGHSATDSFEIDIETQAVMIVRKGFEKERMITSCSGNTPRN